MPPLGFDPRLCRSPERELPHVSADSVFFGHITIDIASVEVNDECRVELRQEKKRTTYSSTQARDLALELIEAAEKADAAIAEDMAERGVCMTHGRVISERGEVVL